MPTVSVHITANSDNASQLVGGALVQTPLLAGFVVAANDLGLRFQSVNVPNAANITVATVTMNVTNVTGAPVTTMYGVAADNVATWNDPANLPSAATRTTANADPDPAGAGTKVVTVTTLVQEIVNRVPWVGGNAMGFVVIDGAGAGNNTFTIEALADAGTAEAVLDITYTTPGVWPTTTILTSEPFRGDVTPPSVATFGGRAWERGKQGW